MKRWYWYAMIVFLAACLFMLLHGLRHAGDVPQIQYKPGVDVPTNIHVEQVEHATITKQDAAVVTKDPADQALIAQLLKEQAGYKTRVQELATALAESRSTGTLIPVPAPNPHPEEPAAPAAAPAPFNMQDYRLTVTSDGKTVNYTLQQKFEALATNGRDRAGKPYLDLKLFELGPGEKRTQIPVVINEAVVDEAVRRWIFGFNIQAGGAKTVALGTDSGYVISLQWLKRGVANNPKDLRYAFLSPGIFMSPTGASLSLLPVSLNVATAVKHQPFTNIWVSPLVGISLAGNVNRVGLALTATF